MSTLSSLTSRHAVAAAVAAVALASVLSACGGGGAQDAPNTSVSGTVSNAATIEQPQLTAGNTTNVTASAWVVGGTPTGMKWSIAPLTATGAAPTFSDADCAMANLTAPVAGTGASAASASGRGVCTAILQVPSNAVTGTWRITNTVTASAGTVSSYADIAVTALPVTGFALLESGTPITGYVGRTVSLNVPFTVNPGATVSDVQYTWTAAASNPATPLLVGSNNSQASVTPTAPGQYRFNAAVKALVNGVVQNSTASVAVLVYPANPMTASISVSAPQTVAPGATVELAGAIANQDPALSYSSTWGQQSDLGVPLLTLANANSAKASFVAPSTPGTYNFTWLVTTTLADGSTVQTATQTSVVVKATATAGAFTVFAGNVQTVAPGATVVLAGSVTGQSTQNTTGQDATTYSYAWSQGTQAAPVTLSNANSTTASFVAPSTPGTYNFVLTVTATTAGKLTTVSNTTQVVVSPSNAQMTANAGITQSVAAGAIVTLTGSVNTQGLPAGTTYLTTWTQIGTTPVVQTLDNAKTLTPSFIANTAGTYTYNLAIAALLPDGSVRSATSNTTVVVRVNSGSGAIGVFAGNAQSVAPGASVTLSGYVMQTVAAGTATSYSYAWSQGANQPAPVTLSNANSQIAGFFAPATPGTYNFVLTATANTNGVLSTASSTTQVVVLSNNAQLAANAGVSQSVVLGAVVKLTGSAVTQSLPGGTTYTYTWAQIGTTPVVQALDNGNTLTPSFIANTAGTYTYRISITAHLPDGTVQTATSDTTVQVK